MRPPTSSTRCARRRVGCRHPARYSAPGRYRVGCGRRKLASAPSAERTSIRNFAEIRYEYQVRGKRYTGSRVSIGEYLGDHGVEQTLVRYPRGSVVTVFYNPDKPDEAVLERDAPEGVWRTMVFFILVLLGLFIGGTLGFDRVVASLADTLNDPARAAPVVAFLGLAAFMTLMGLALRRQVQAVQGWPTTMGVIETAQVESFLSYDRKANQSASDGVISMRWQRYFRPDVIYRYLVDKMDYRGSRISLGGRLYATFDAFARASRATRPVPR